MMNRVIKGQVTVENGMNCQYFQNVASSEKQLG